MSKRLEEIFAARRFTTSAVKVVQLRDETPLEQCRYLQSIIRENGFRDSIEIGFALGLSALAIIDEIVKNGGKHTVIDIFQNTLFEGDGIELIKLAGHQDRLEFFEEYCYKVLPKMLLDNRRFDFAYVDSTKQLDWLMVDFFFLDKLIKINGIIVFDDVNYPGIRKLLRYISQFPGYKVDSQFPKNYRPTWPRRLAAGFLRRLPFSRRLLKKELLLTDYDLGISARCVALRKVADDTVRDWKWHVEF